MAWLPKTYGKRWFQTKKCAKNKNDNSIAPEDVDWAFVLSNEEIRKNTNTTEINHFCHIQHLKYIAHVSRLSNECLQKQLLFTSSSHSSRRWGKLSNLTGIDESQLRRTMRDRKKFLQVLSHIQ